MVADDIARLRRSAATNWALCAKAQRNHKPADEKFYREAARKDEDDLLRKYRERTVGMDDDRDDVVGQRELKL